MSDKEQKDSTKSGEGAAKSYYNAAPVPIDLSDGRMLQPSEQIAADDLPMNRHNKFHVDVGNLMEVTES